MDNEIALTFTPWQLIAAVGAISLIVLTIYIVGLVREFKKTARQLDEILTNVNEIVEDIQVTKMVVVSKIAEIKRISDIVSSFKTARERFTRKKKKNKKNKKKKGED